ncbi:MAG: hypothetical protein QM778_23285 [Myxococcales bacterium]
MLGKRVVGRALLIAGGLGWLGLSMSCGDDPQKGELATHGSAATLKGRAFSADTGEPLGQAKVVVGDSATQSDDKGAFSLKHQTSDKTLVVHADQHAPVSKTAPENDGYIEVMAKRYDAQKEIDASVGGEAKTANGASVKVDGDKLRDESGASVKEATLSIAAPNPQKAQELGSLPGEFKAEKQGKLGKVSAESPVYVNASRMGKDLVLKAGATATLSMPAHDKSRDKAPGSTLYRFDDEQNRWLEVGPVLSTTDEAGAPVYQVEIDRFGWFTVGNFVQGLSCVSSCVVDGAGKPIAYARASATGVDLFTQDTAYADAQGCFALEVPANARLSVVAQAEAQASQAVVVQSGSGGSLADPSSCKMVENIVLAAPRQDTQCPLGYSQCGASCVDLASDSQHCGDCSTVCDDVCAGAACVMKKEPMVSDAGVIIQDDAGDPAVPLTDAGLKTDAGVGPVKDGGPGAIRDAGTMTPDAGVPHDAGATGGMDAGKDSGTGGFDAGAVVNEAGVALDAS